MPRPVLLFSGPWADLPLESLAAKAAGWKYDGFELCCWGDHLEVQRGISDESYCPARLDLLARHDLHVPVVANHKVGQAVSDVIDRRHQGLLPDYVWGDGNPSAVAQRAARLRLPRLMRSSMRSAITPWRSINPGSRPMRDNI